MVKAVPLAGAPQRSGEHEARPGGRGRGHPASVPGRRETPLADALVEVAGRGRCHNFHALPGAVVRRDRSEGGPEPSDAPLPDVPLPDVSLSGWALDSFLDPQGPLRDAHRLAARAFGAAATFFLSCGTSAANRAVLDALAPRGPVLIDALSHQSVFFAAQAAAHEVAWIPAVARHGLRYTDVAAAIDMLAERRAAGRPYGMVAINAASYDGHRLRLADILPRFARASPDTVVFVDEAWTAIHTFSPQLAQHSALSVVGALVGRSDPVPTVVVTQSAHKTMHALRQGSYLHVAGPDPVIDELRGAVSRNHTTSPSWPILASLDAAREHAERRGAEAVEEALRLRELLAGRLRADPRLVRFSAGRVHGRGPGPPGGFHVPNPMMLWLGADGREAAALRRYLYDEHHVYLPRSGPQGLLTHFHLGVSEDDVLALVDALVAWERAGRPAPPSRPGTDPDPDQDQDPTVGRVVDNYVLPYPPGVPLARPGEVWTAEHAAALAAERAAGSGVVRISHPPAPRH